MPGWPGGVALLVQVCACARHQYAQRELKQGQSTLLSWGKMDCKYCKLLRGIGTEGEGGGKTSSYQDMQGN